jgi:hypothetical protein
MSMEDFEIPSQSTPEDYLSEISLTNIYLSLSEEINTDFDMTDLTEKINTIMSEIYDKDFLLKSTEIIQGDQILINRSFVSLIKETEKIRYRQYSIIFLIYCDYFDLDSNKTFKLLHEKIRNIIEKSVAKVVGEKLYQKAKKQNNLDSVHNGIKITSIFDL